MSAADDVINELNERAASRARREIRTKRRRRVDDRPLGVRLLNLAELAEIREHDDDYALAHWVGTVDRDGKRVEIEGSITVADLRHLVRLVEGRG